MAKALEVANLADPTYRLSLMLESVRALQQAAADGADLHYPLLNLVSVYLDGLASGTPNGTRDAYVAYLTTNFPELCAELGAAVSYKSFRCKAVHEFGLGASFAIGRDGDLKGRYANSLPSTMGDIMAMSGCTTILI